MNASAVSWSVMRVVRFDFYVCLDKILQYICIQLVLGNSDILVLAVGIIKVLLKLITDDNT